MVDGTSPRRADRRKFLKTTVGAAAIGTVGLAGCTGGGDGGGGDGGGGDGGDDGGDGGGGEMTTEEMDDFPTENITWIVPYSTGGGFDTYSRGLAQFMPDHLPNDVNVVVQNVTGAGGRRGITQLYRAEPDGYTVGIWNIPGLIASQIVLDTEYDVAQVSWIGRIARSIYMMAVPADSEFETLEDLQNADNVKFGVTGPGSTSYLSTVIAANVMDIPAEFVTGYEGSQESVAAALRGDVDAAQYPATTPSLKNPIENGDMRAIIYYGEEAPDFVPDVLTAPDAGYPGLVGQVNLQRLIGGPPGIPDNRVAILEQALLDTATSDEFEQWAEDQGRPLDPAGAEETAAAITEAQETYSQYRELLEEQLQ